MHAFVFNWKGHEAGAAALEEKIARHTRVTVINSEEGLDEAHPHWDHLDDSAYFSAQWNRAIELFDGDLLFHIQADARFDEFERLLAKIDHVFRTYPVGVYEPNVDFTDVTYHAGPAVRDRTGPAGRADDGLHLLVRPRRRDQELPPNRPFGQPARVGRRRGGGRCFTAAGRKILRP